MNRKINLSEDEFELYFGNLFFAEKIGEVSERKTKKKNINNSQSHQKMPKLVEYERSQVSQSNLFNTRL